MNNNVINIELMRSVVAIAQADDKLMGIELRQKKDAYEVLWAKSSEYVNTSRQLFAAECGLSVDPTTEPDTDGDRIIVAGFNSEGMAFYRISVPKVEEAELGAIVHLQAETLLPLKAEQMELAWRADEVKNEKVGITIAAARRQRLEEFVENVRSFEPTKILLDCEGIVKVWSVLFSGNEENAVIVNPGLQTTQVCLAENGRLSNAVVLDMGMEDLGFDGGDEQTEATERFAQDMTSVLELFGGDMSAQMPVCVLSNGNTAYVSMVSSLRLAGLNARVALPDIHKLTSKSKINVEDIYEYRMPIGLGLMALEADVNELNIFKRLYSPSRQRVKKHWLYSPKITSAIAAAMLILFVIVSYAVDVASPNAIEERLRASSSEADIDQLMQRQKLIKAVAQQRPDLVELLYQINRKFLFGAGLKFQGDLDKGIISEDLRREFEKNDIRLSPNATVTVERANSMWLISERSRKYSIRKHVRTLEFYGISESGGIKLESFYFKKGQPVTITGQAPNNDQLYEFQESLQERKDIKDVKMTASQNTSGAGRSNSGSSSSGRGPSGPSGPSSPSSARGPGGRGLKFSITFHYKNFTK